MSEQTDRPTVVDCAVHPVPPSLDALRRHMPEPWRSRLKTPEASIYHADIPAYAARYASGGAPPGSDPTLAGRQLLLESGADFAVLMPLTWGLLADPEFGSAIAAAMNRWLDETWLADDSWRGRFKGSIRVCPTDPARAVREIERWGGHPAFVQVAVPLITRSPYGSSEFLPIWEAACCHGLPVAVHAELGSGGGIDSPPTLVGFPSHFVEYYTMLPYNAMVHLTSLICQGVFDRLESLVFVFADGALDALRPLLWRVDKHWRALRYEVPWVLREPTTYLRDHVRFVTHRADWPVRDEDVDEALHIVGAEQLLMFGSGYPYWDAFDLAEARRCFPPAVQGPILGGNAQRLYGLASPATT